MNYSIQKKAAYSSLVEFFIVSILSILFLSKMLFYMVAAIKVRPGWLDYWHQCFLLEYQVTRILGLNSGRIWEGGFWYPFHNVSLLLGEPSWGVSLLISPIWAFTKNIFPIFRMGGIVALYMAWIFTYYFVKSLGGNKVWGFCAAATFCLSGVSLILLSQQYAFWPFFFIPLLGLITRKIFSTSKLYWGVLWGIVFGYLAWSSVHLFAMGGLFICLFVLWNLSFNNRSKKTFLTLVFAFIISAISAGVVLGSMYLIHKRFSFSRGYYEPYWYSSNLANLIYRGWPDTPLNPIAKTQFWEYLKTNAKGATNIGMSIFLLLSAPLIVIKRLKESISQYKVNKYSKCIFIGVIIISILFAFLNMYSLTVKCVKLKMPLPQLASGLTCLCYAIIGSIIFILRHRISSAIKHLDFFFILIALLFGLLSFGPYYLTKNGLAIVSPVAFLIYHVSIFSGIQATARWGLVFSFTISISVAIFLSKHTTNYRLKLFTAMFMLIIFLELSPGFQMLDFKNLSPYKWKPRQTDIFLKELPGNDAVLEMSSYPPKEEDHVVSDNSLGYVIFSHLYHKKPLVVGYSSYVPHASYRYLLHPRDKTLSFGVINTLRKFGARYWVFHIEDWSSEQLKLLKDSIGELKKIAALDSGKTLIFEDPCPKISVGYFDVF